MKKLMYSLLISIIMLLMFSIKVYGFENEIYKIDVPRDYKESSQNGSSIFIKSNDTAIIILAEEDEGLKKNISTMSKSEINEFVDRLNNAVGYKAEVIDQGKEKIGKFKAIKVRLKSTESNSYMDMYLLASDKHNLAVAFMTKSESDLDSVEFMEIKKSFVMKEKTTNVTIIRLIEFLAIAGGVGFGIFKKVKN